MQERFEIKSGPYRITGVFAAPDQQGKFPCVILSHGLISSKESSKYIALTNAFLTAGIAACRFDYHGCGESEGNVEDTTLTIRVENLNAVTDWVLGLSYIDTEKIGLLGSSFGGSTSLVKAATDKRIRCVSLWATPCSLDRKDEGGVSEIEFKDALFEDFKRYDLLAEARKVSCALVIHGQKDDVVPPSEGKAIYNNLRKPKKFELIKGGDHTFSVPNHREKAITLALNWFRRFFL